MRSGIIRTFVFGFFLLCSTYVNSATIPNSLPEPGQPVTVYQKMASLHIRDLQKLTGRKLTLKEKIGFLFLKQKIKHQEKTKQDSGKLSLVFGIVGLALFFASFGLGFLIFGSLLSAILAVVTGSIATREDPKNKKAYAGKLLGFITLGLILVLLTLAIVALSTIFG